MNSSDQHFLSLQSFFEKGDLLNVFTGKMSADQCCRLGSHDRKMTVLISKKENASLTSFSVILFYLKSLRSHEIWPSTIYIIENVPQMTNMTAKQTCSSLKILLETTTWIQFNPVCWI